MFNNLNRELGKNLRKVPVRSAGDKVRHYLTIKGKYNANEPLEELGELEIQHVAKASENMKYNAKFSVIKGKCSWWKMSKTCVGLCYVLLEHK